MLLANFFIIMSYAMQLKRHDIPEPLLPAEIVRFDLMNALDMPSLINFGLVSQGMQLLSRDALCERCMERGIDGNYYPSSTKLFSLYSRLRQDQQLGDDSLILYTKRLLRNSLVKGNKGTDIRISNIPDHALRKIVKLALSPNMAVTSYIFKMLVNTIPGLLRELLKAYKCEPVESICFGADQDLINWSIKHCRADLEDQFIDACSANASVETLRTISLELPHMTHALNCVLTKGIACWRLSYNVPVDHLCAASIIHCSSDLDRARVDELLSYYRYGPSLTAKVSVNLIIYAVEAKVSPASLATIVRDHRHKFPDHPSNRGLILVMLMNKVDVAVYASFIGRDRYLEIQTYLDSNEIPDSFHEKCFELALFLGYTDAALKTMINSYPSLDLYLIKLFLAAKRSSALLSILLDKFDAYIDTDEEVTCALFGTELDEPALLKLANLHRNITHFVLFAHAHRKPDDQTFLGLLSCIKALLPDEATMGLVHLLLKRNRSEELEWFVKMCFKIGAFDALLYSWVLEHQTNQQAKLLHLSRGKILDGFSGASDLKCILAVLAKLVMESGGATLPIDDPLISKIMDKLDDQGVDLRFESPPLLTKNFLSFMLAQGILSEEQKVCEIMSTLPAFKRPDLVLLNSVIKMKPEMALIWLKVLIKSSDDRLCC